MPIRSAPQSTIYPYHVYNRSIDKAFYPIDLTALWTKASQILKVLSSSYGIEVHAFVLMSNHYHLLLTAPDGNLSQAIRYFQTEFSRWLKGKTGSQSYRFSGKYKASLILCSDHYKDILFYIYRNPLDARIVQDLRDYPASTLTGRFDQSTLLFPVQQNRIFEAGLETTSDAFLDSLHSEHMEATEELTKRGLRRSVVSYGKT